MQIILDYYKGGECSYVGYVRGAIYIEIRWKIAY